MNELNSTVLVQNSAASPSLSAAFCIDLVAFEDFATSAERYGI